MACRGAVSTTSTPSLAGRAHCRCSIHLHAFCAHLRSAPRSLPFLLAARFSGLLSSFFERLFTTAPLLVLPLSGPCLTWTACLCDALGHPLFSGPSVGTKHLACPGDFDPTYTTRRAALVASCRSVFYAPFAQLGPPYLPVALHGNCLGGSGWVHQPKPARVLAGRQSARPDCKYCARAGWRLHDLLSKKGQANA